MILSADGPDSKVDASRARRQRKGALLVMVSSLVCLVVVGLILWHLVTNRILSAWDQSAPDAPRGAPALAVLPFESESEPASGGESVGEEVAADLIERISKLDYFPVAGRQESFAYRTGQVDVKRVGRALGVRYVVEGYVRRTEDRIRLRARLFDARTARLVWSEDHEVEPGELPVVQRRLARLITSAVLVDAKPDA